MFVHTADDDPRVRKYESNSTGKFVHVGTHSPSDLLTKPITGAFLTPVVRSQMTDAELAPFRKQWVQRHAEAQPHALRLF